MEPAGEVHPDIGGEPITPSAEKFLPKRPRKPRAKWALPYPAETEHAEGSKGTTTRR